MKMMTNMPVTWSPSSEQEYDDNNDNNDKNDDEYASLPVT